VPDGEIRVHLGGHLFGKLIGRDLPAGQGKGRDGHRQDGLAPFQEHGPGDVVRLVSGPDWPGQRNAGVGKGHRLAH